MFGHGFFRISYLVLILNCAQLQVHFKNCTSATTLELHKGGDISLLSAHTQHFLHLGIRNNNAPRSKFFQLQKIWERAYCAGYMCIVLPLRYVYGPTVVYRGGITYILGKKPKWQQPCCLLKENSRFFPIKNTKGPAMIAGMSSVAQEHSWMVGM